MIEQTAHKTFKYRLKPTPEQARMIDRTLMLCRHVYNAAVGERREAWRMRGISVNHYQQKAELPEIKAAMPEYGEVNGQVLQDVVQRVDRAFQSFFRRVKAGETPGYPRFQGRNRFNSLTYPQVGEHGGARLDNGVLVLSKLGRIAVRWSRPLEGTPKTVTISREADGWYACISCADVPVQLLPSTGQETGIDLGLESFATLANGERILTPACYRKAERRLKRLQRCVSRRKKGREMGKDPDREPPFFFTKPADAVVNDGETVRYPPLTKDFHYEAELIVAIGKQARNVSIDDALDYIWGYGVGNDLTRRDLQLAARDKGRPWDEGKAFDRSAVIGPLHRVSAVGHPSSGSIRLMVNGVVKQDADLAELIWSVPEIISILSQSQTLEPGDLIMTGTPAGVGPLVSGDVCVVQIEGLGEITTTID